MGGARSKELKTLREQVQVQQLLIKRYQERMSAWEQDMEHYHEAAASNATETERLVVAAQVILQNAEASMEHLELRCRHIPPLPVELLNINGHLLPRDEIVSVDAESYKNERGRSRGRVVVNLTSCEFKVVLDDTTMRRAWALVDFIHKQLRSPREYQTQPILPPTYQQCQQ